MNEKAVIEHEDRPDIQPVTAVAVQPESQSNLAPMVQAVMDGKMTPEVLQQMLGVQKEWERNEAEKAFHQALADFKKHDLTLEKDKLVSFEMNAGGTKSYRHTTLGYALSVINPLLSQHGLSLTWETKQDMEHGGLITVTCVLSHAMGFSKSTSLSASADASGNKNSIQAIGSTISYLERYTAFSLTGVASMDQDNDGVDADPPKLITKEQALEIHALITDNDLDMQKFLNWLKRSVKADSIDGIAAAAYQQVKRQIQSSIKHKDSEA